MIRDAIRLWAYLILSLVGVFLHSIGVSGVALFGLIGSLGGRLVDYSLTFEDF